MKRGVRTRFYPIAVALSIFFGSRIFVLKAFCQTPNDKGKIVPLSETVGLNPFRLNLIDISRVYEINTQMSDRIRKLEAALAELQGKYSVETHPLLTEELLALGIPIEPPRDIENIKPSTGSSLPNSRGAEEALEGFGTLALGPDGHTMFFGNSAVADVSLSMSFFIISRTEPGPTVRIGGD